MSLTPVPEAAAVSTAPAPTLPPLAALPATQQGNQGAAAASVTTSALMAASQPAVPAPPAVMMPVVPAPTDAAGEADAEPMEEQAGEPEADVMEADDVAGMRCMQQGCLQQMVGTASQPVCHWVVAWGCSGLNTLTQWSVAA